ncbi:MAG: GntR family transcriptional regulator, partial [Lachnospiraceae bacterium]|nr:GntR family transcriptional regulator [Lachnospiraceae bacterium]
GFIRLDRRNGAVIFLEEDKSQAISEMRETFQVILAKAVCKNISRKEIHQLIDEIFDEYES